MVVIIIIFVNKVSQQNNRIYCIVIVFFIFILHLIRIDCHVPNPHLNVPKSLTNYY